ncbi:hypothetical protein ABRT01_16140 [Lentibacillus sp. L22]|uniref:hypothetical protein n=1 Tax=Lentibacillus TaxID=175304 RepID=UPI0022B0B46E|nr:hypothetical protein [Lentibacillus daqui]
MSLTSTDIEKLFKLGFKRPEYADDVYPQDVYEYQNATWTVGGRIAPSSYLLCDEEIYKQGTWIPSLEDYIIWLEENNCTFNLSFDGFSYKVLVTCVNEQNYKGKGVSLEVGLFNVTIQILRDFGGAPVQKKYKVIDAEIIEKEDL